MTDQEAFDLIVHNRLKLNAGYSANTDMEFKYSVLRDGEGLFGDIAILLHKHPKVLHELLERGCNELPVSEYYDLIAERVTGGNLGITFPTQQFAEDLQEANDEIVEHLNGCPQPEDRDDENFIFNEYLRLAGKHGLNEQCIRSFIGNSRF